MKKIAAMICLTALLGACDKEDKFDEVKPVTAPEASKTNSGIASSDAVGDSMPSDHPPIGDVPPIPRPDSVRFASPDQYGKTGPLRWTAPSSWQASRPGSSMRLAEYLIPGAPEAGVLSIFHFPNGGGGVDANLKRWIGQFTGGPEAKTAEKTVNGLTVHTVDAAGEYNPGMAGAGAPPKTNFRMLGAIIDINGGLFVFKLIGPKDVVAGEEANWNSFIDSFSKG